MDDESRVVLRHGGDEYQVAVLNLQSDCHNLPMFNHPFYVLHTGALEDCIIVDYNFKDLYDVVSCTQSHMTMLASKPAQFIGTVTEYQNAIMELCHSAVESLRHARIHPAPWRQPETIVDAFKSVLAELFAFRDAENDDFL